MDDRSRRGAPRTGPRYALPTQVLSVVRLTARTGRTGWQAFASRAAARGDAHRGSRLARYTAALAEAPGRRDPPLASGALLLADLTTNPRARGTSPTPHYS